MAYERKEGDIVLFEQEPSERRPRLKGSIIINGEEWEVALWTKKGKRGDFYAGQAKPKQKDPDW